MATTHKPSLILGTMRSSESICLAMMTEKRERASEQRLGPPATCAGSTVGGADPGQSIGRKAHESVPFLASGGGVAVVTPRLTGAGLALMS